MKHHPPRVCPHCSGCWDAMPNCDFCNGNGEVICEECGDVTGFSATVKTERGELCSACAHLIERDAA